jgi:hypothetical protein
LLWEAAGGVDHAHPAPRRIAVGMSSEDERYSTNAGPEGSPCRCTFAASLRARSHVVHGACWRGAPAPTESPLPPLPTDQEAEDHNDGTPTHGQGTGSHGLDTS